MQPHTTNINSLRDICVHELIAAQAGRTPQALALTFEGQGMTYCELDLRANQLAHALRRIGVGPEKLVGLCVERSLEMVVAVLAILKAGGAYVPLDPAFPPERLAFMLGDARAEVLLTEQAIFDRLFAHEITKQQVLLLDTGRESFAEEPVSAPETGVCPENLAYVIYTSGSTGRPKGSLIPHQALLGFLQAFQHVPGMNEHDVVLGRTTLSFDPSMVELFLPLMIGARVALISRAAASDGTLLRDALEYSGATIAQLTPSHCRMLLSADWRGNPNLKLLCGAEPLPRDLADALLECSGELWNIYGPTETTVWATAGRVLPDEDPISVGGQIDNVQITILDDQLRPVAPGEIGEIHISGVGVGRGYLNRPDLTAEKFVPEPLADSEVQSSTSGRMYKTGDLGRFLPDGRIVFIGRKDFQIKIRGYRIEPGEIESVLLRHPAIRQAVVTARADQAGEPRIVAYLVPGNGEAPSAMELRELLHSQLPEYMVPAIFVALDTLPLTPTGKLDRQALPAPQPAELARQQPLVAPRTPLEYQLVALWVEAFGKPEISVHDHFVELGGHSLLATRLVSQIRTTFQIELLVRSLFDAPSIAELADHILALQAIQQIQTTGTPEDGREEGEL